MLREIFLLFLGITAAEGATWNYKIGDDNGPAKWGDDCNKTSQSPIDVKNAEYKNTLTAFTFNGYDTVDGVLHNNGHTVQFSVNEVDSVAKMTGGGLDGTFQLAQFHFHWGKVDTTGSEHLLNGKQYPLEVHFVHYNTKYGNLSNAVDKDDGLAVLGYFFEIGPENADYKPVFDGLIDVKDNGTVRSPLAALNVAKLLGSGTQKYYRYPGSLTTPPCYQSVTWTVFDERVMVSAAQMAQVRAMTDTKGTGNPIGENFRPAQALNGRKVYTNEGQWGPDESGENDSGAGISACMALMVTGFAAVWFL